MFIDGVLIGALLGIAEFIVIAIAARVIETPVHQKTTAQKNKQLVHRPLLISN